MSRKPSGRRGLLHTPGWGRLKPATIDPLQSMGLPSKGETRLNDFAAQEAYYATMTERYMQFCARAGNGDELERRFASLGVSRESPELQEGKISATPAMPESSSDMQELNLLLSAMRKIREAIVATSRHDAFAQQAYIFIIRASVLVQAWESYHVAILYLLQDIHPYLPLSVLELQEFVGYRILDLACRQRDFGAALTVAWQYRFRHRRVDQVVKALIGDDWVLFWRMQRLVDGHQRRLLTFAADGMRKHALKCLGRSYFTVEKSFVERSAAMPWEALRQEHNVGWELENDRVTIRRPKGR